MTAVTWRDRWRLMSFESKLGILVAPLLLALITGIAIPRLNDATAPGSSSELEVVDVALRDGRRQSYTRGGRTYREGKPSMTLTLANRGTSSAVITRVNFRVLASQALPACYTAGYVEVSRRYDVLLPAHATREQVIARPVSQDVPAGGSDRFRLTFDVPNKYMSALGESGFNVYVLEITLSYDGNRSLAAGRVLVAVPETPEGGFFDTRGDKQVASWFGAGAVRCRRTQRRRFRTILHQHAQRAEGLQALTTEANG